MVLKSGYPPLPVFTPTALLWIQPLSINSTLKLYNQAGSKKLIATLIESLSPYQPLAGQTIKSALDGSSRCLIGVLKRKRNARTNF
jgi:hypothetical protein